MARILITRAPHQASVVAARLRALGHEPILIPTIEIADPSTFAPLDAALTRLAASGPRNFNWLLFISASAVEGSTTACYSLLTTPSPSTPCLSPQLNPAFPPAHPAHPTTPSLTAPVG